METLTTKMDVYSKPIHAEPENLSLEYIDDVLSQQGYFLLYSEEIRSLAEKARKEYLIAINQNKIYPASERFTYNTLCQQGLWRKAAIGSGSVTTKESYAQLLLTTYFHSNSADQYPALNELFSKMILLRNRLMRVSPDFGSNPAIDKFWDARRVHHYPQGGGFMAAHRDTYFPIKLENKPFYQICVLLSIKDQDFHQGGGYVISTRSQEKIDVESALGFGGLVIFDGKTVHGVDDVDNHGLINLHSQQGRFAAFVNSYVYIPDEY